MKIQFLFVLLSSYLCFGQNKTEKAIQFYSIDQYVKPVNNLSTEAALESWQAAFQKQHL